MVLSIKESREFAIFQAFSANGTYNSALEALEKFDEGHPESKILAGPEDKRALFESYKIFREAERPLKRENTAPDYDDMQVVERLKTILSQKLPAISREVLLSSAQGVVMNKANIGRMLAVHARNFKTIGRKELAAHKLALEKEYREKTALTERQGRVNSGGYGGGAVFSVKSGSYKTTAQMIKERVIAESTEMRNG